MAAANKASQPFSANGDGKQDRSPQQDQPGLQWLVQSAVNPENWIYQTNSGDILISPESNQQQPVPQQSSVIASEKTYQSLIRADQASSSAPAASEDPWLHKDPWQPAHSAMLSSQLKTIETNLEKKIIKQLHEDDKMDVDSDRRMTELESRATHIRIWCLSKNACTAAYGTPAAGHRSGSKS
jgi:hypothetical protein